MKRYLLLFFLLAFSLMAFTQNISITDDNGYTADPSAMLDVKSDSKGMLVPRLTSLQRSNVSNPATGLLVFDTDEGSFFFYNGTQWVNLSSGGDVWTKTGSNVHLSDNNDKVGVGTATPYAKLGVKGSVPIGSSEPLFEVVNSSGDTVFAVYSEGVHIKVADNANKATGSRGGFAVGGFSSAKGNTHEYLRVTPDSVRIYIEDSIPAKATGSKGGFAVGGFSSAKGATDSLYLFSDKSGLNVSYLTSTERDAIIDPRMSSIIFNTTDSCLQIFLGYWESIWCTPMNCVYPIIVAQPSDVELQGQGSNATFTVDAQGSKIYYKWQESNDGGITWRMLTDGGSNPAYSGAYTNALTLSNIPLTFSSYKYRCLIVNACGSLLSNPAELVVWECGQNFTDSRDSRTYGSVLIGSQCWMSENLDVGLMVNSSIGGQLQTNNGIIEKYCYNNNLSSCTTYGGLYEWDEMMQYGSSDNGNPGTTKGICPSGWHLPTDTEWSALFATMGGINVAAGKMKEVGFTHWSSPNTAATDEFGFTALPGGRRHYADGTFSYLSTHAQFGNATQYSAANAYYLDLHYSYADVARLNDFKTCGFSVRCIKD